MKLKPTILLATIALSVFVGKINAQTKQLINKNCALNWTLKEKIKIDVNKLNSLQKEGNLNITNLKNANAQGEVIISGSSAAESELHAIINPIDTANIVVSPISQDGGVHCPVYYTTDFGDTWQTSSFTNMPYESGKSSMGGGDPVFAADANGRMYFSWIDLYGDVNDLIAGSMPMGIFWAYSDDGGANWTRPTHDTVLLGHMNPLTNAVIDPISDKQWMAVDRTGGTYANNLYISFVTIGQDDNGNAFYKIRCKTKPADTLDFTIAADVTDTIGAKKFYFVQFSSLDVDNNGNVHVTFYGSQTGYDLGIFHSVSMDGGSTFTIPNKISDVKFNLPMFQQAPYDTIVGINNDRTYPSPYVACDQNNGNIYMTWTAFGITSDAGQKSQVYFSKSTDNGTNWSTPITINDDNANVDNYYSAIIVAPNGDVKVGWYDRRGDIANNINTNYYFATSTDGGDTFGQNTLVTSIPTDFSTVGSTNSNFGIGEYNQILSTENYTIPVWTDGRTNDGNLNIYAAFLSPTYTGVNRIQTINENISMKNIYPNPIKTNASVEYTIKKDSKISALIIDNKGVIIKTPLSNKIVNKGTNSITFNANDLENGLYYFVLESNFGKNHKIIYCK